MFGIGFLEICVITVVTLVFVGPKKLPDIMKQLGRLFIYLKRTSVELQTEFQKSLDEIEQETKQETKQEIKQVNKDNNDNSQLTESSTSVSTNDYLEAQIASHQTKNKQYSKYNTLDNSMVLPSKCREIQSSSDQEK